MKKHSQAIYELENSVNELEKALKNHQELGYKVDVEYLISAVEDCENAIIFLKKAQQDEISKK